MTANLGLPDVTMLAVLGDLYTSRNVPY